VGQEYEFAKEFEVWARIIKDSEGRDIHVFRKEDELRKFRRDSSFYWDGYWEVFEFDDLARETRYRTSSGTRSLRKYDDKERLTERYMMGENGDTLTSERYEWKNGRLTRMTANGVVRNYIYGKTLQDMVRVVPSDEGFNFHRGYNGTAGKIPEEGTPEYEIFAMEPYGHVYFGDYDEEDDELLDENFVARNSSSPNILARTINYGCVTENTTITPRLPKAQCIRYEKKDIPNNAPKNGLYGHADAQLFISFSCECNAATGKYLPLFKARTVNEKIEVYQSVWRYNFLNKGWHEFCWGPNDLQITYAHEAQHIKNARYVANRIETFTSGFTYDTKKRCEEGGKKERENRIKTWSIWYEWEQKHKSEDPVSPKQKIGVVYEISCY
jgi:hypothetical protein